MSKLQEAGHTEKSVRFVECLTYGRSGLAGEDKPAGHLAGVVQGGRTCSVDSWSCRALSESTVWKQGTIPSAR